MAAIWPASSHVDVDNMLRVLASQPLAAAVREGSMAAGDAGAAPATGAAVDEESRGVAFPPFGNWFVSREGAMSAVQVSLLGGDDDSHLLPVSKRNA